MKSLTVIQHTSAEYLGLMEDHFEGRRIRFNYFRPFTEDGRVPIAAEAGDCLVLLGGGPWGTAGTRDVPTLAEEVALARAYYMSGRPVIAIGLGAQILCLAADGGSEEAPLTLDVVDAKRVDKEALNGFLPEQYPMVRYMRDRPVPPSFARILAVDPDGAPALFQIGDNMFGFSGHPGVKRGIIEDLIMEFEESPQNVSAPLDEISKRQSEIEDALVPIMTGLIQLTGLMRD
ncbi:MAG: hypothetical protein AAGJ73_09695 [Pseudomonadota bacterium]